VELKSELNPMIFWAALGVVILGVIGFVVFRMRTPSGFQTTGSEAQIEKVKKTGEFYRPPAGVPGLGGNAPGYMPPGAPGMPGAAPGVTAPMPGGMAPPMPGAPPTPGR
jgi:hypothetical protein